MRLSLLGDIHGNLTALEAVLETLARKAALDGLLVVGDIVGYGPDPGPCVQLLRDYVPLACLGNHDSAACGQIGLEYFNTTARYALEWTQSQLDSSVLEWLAGLPLIVQHEESAWTLSHSGLFAPNEFLYIMDAVDAAPTMERMKTFACAFGHTHAPIIYYQKASGGQVIARLFSEGVLALPSPRGRLLLNVGSVGQPRDGDPRACAAIYDQEQRSIEMLRVPYDIRATRRRILQVGLPAFLGDRLLEGW